MTRLYNSLYYRNILSLFDALYQYKDKLGNFCNNVVFNIEDKRDVRSITNLDYNIAIRDKEIRITNNQGIDYTMRQLLNSCLVEKVTDTVSDITLKEFYQIFESAFNSIKLNLETIQ